MGPERGLIQHGLRQPLGLITWHAADGVWGEQQQRPVSSRWHHRSLLCPTLGCQLQGHWKPYQPECVGPVS